MSDYSMDDFRRELVARGVYKSGRPVMTAAEQKTPRGRMGGRRESWPMFCARTRDAAERLLASLASLKADHLIACTLVVLPPHPPDCCCRGTGTRTVGELRDAAHRLLVEFGAKR